MWGACDCLPHGVSGRRQVLGEEVCGLARCWHNRAPDPEAGHRSVLAVGPPRHSPAPTDDDEPFVSLDGATEQKSHQLGVC